MLKDDILNGETVQMEFKLRPSETFLKTVVAFANCGGGKILFGIADDRTVVGVEGDVFKVWDGIVDAIADAIVPAMTWGFGLPKVFARIVASGLPVPEIIDWGNAIRIVVRRWSDSQKGSQKKVVGSKQKVIALMQSNPAISTQQIADELKVTRRTVAKIVLELKMAGVVRRIGPDRGGHWEVIESINAVAAEKESL